MLKPDAAGDDLVEEVERSDGMRQLIIGLVAVTMWAAPAAGTDAQTSAPRGGAFIVVPHPTGDVYVPLDALARPQFPAFPAVPPAPGAPAAPPTPGVSVTGYLSVDVEPGAAHVYVDGVYASVARELARGRAALALRPGLRRIEVVLAGYRSLTAIAEIVGGELRTLTAVLEPDPRSTGVPRSAVPDGGGYFVVPPATRAPEPPGAGGGYHVVPRP